MSSRSSVVQFVRHTRLAGESDGGPQRSNLCIPAGAMACDPVRDEGSALTLLVARVVADDHHATVATNDLALVAHLLDARANLHQASLSRNDPLQGSGWISQSTESALRGAPDSVPVLEPPASNVTCDGRRCDHESSRRETTQRRRGLTAEYECSADASCH